MIEKASIYTMNALYKSSELWHTSVNRQARPVVEGEHDKSWNDHGSLDQFTSTSYRLVMITDNSRQSYKAGFESS